MKPSHRILSLVLAVLFALTLFPLSASAAVKIAPPKQTQYVDIGGVMQLVIPVTGAKKGASLPITFASNNAGIATVDANGIVTGVAKGTATITATYEKQVIAIPVYVCEALVTYTDGESFQISYPKSWVSDDPSQFGSSCKGAFASVFTDSNDRYREHIMVYRYKKTNDNAQKFASEMIGYFEEDLYDFVLLDKSKTKIAGLDGYRVIYYCTTERGTPIKEYMFLVVTRKYEYLFSYTAEEANFDMYAIEVKRSFDSIRLFK